MVPLLILNYHRITIPGERIDPRYRDFTLGETVFRRQLETIRELGIPVIDLQNAFTENNSSASLNIALTFDDGHLSDLTIAAALLTEFGFPATFFPVTEQIGREGYLDWEQLKELQNRGFAIGSHSLEHPIMTRLDEAAIEREIRGAKELLTHRLGTEISLFSIPYGRYSHTILEKVRAAGHTHALSTDPGINRSDTFLLKRWNIKASTTPEMFRSILFVKRKYLRYRRITTSAKNRLNRLADTFSHR